MQQQHQQGYGCDVINLFRRIQEKLKCAQKGGFGLKLFSTFHKNFGEKK